MPAKRKALNTAGVFHFTTPDGVDAMVEISQGTDADAKLATRLSSDGNGYDLVELDLVSKFSPGYFDGANVTISTKDAKYFVDVAAINGAAVGSLPGINLGEVRVQGDLGLINVGANNGKPALGLLEVQSLGIGNPNVLGSIQNQVMGALTKLHVVTDIQNVMVFALGRIGEVVIGGSLIGDTISTSARIYSAQSIGTVTISGDIRGGTGVVSALLDCPALGSLLVKGNVIGGMGIQSGAVWVSGACGPVEIGQQNGSGSLVGGSGYGSGTICVGTLTSVKVWGSVQAGSGANSGMILRHGGTGNITIHGNVNAPAPPSAGRPSRVL